MQLLTEIYRDSRKDIKRFLGFITFLIVFMLFSIIYPALCYFYHGEKLLGILYFMAFSVGIVSGGLLVFFVKMKAAIPGVIAAVVAIIGILFCLVLMIHSFLVY